MDMGKDRDNYAILDGVAFDDAGAGAPAEFLVLKFGRTAFVKGGERGEIDFTPEDAARVVAAFRSEGRDLVVDYDHQTMRGGEAPAAGWIRSLEAGPAGLVCRVEWTARGRERLDAREYRYMSPVLHFGADGRHPVRVSSVALTNHPAFEGYRPLVADDGPGVTGRNKGEHRMDEHLKKIAEALGVAVAFDDKDGGAAFAEAAAGKARELRQAADAAAAFLALHGAKTFDDVTGKIKGMVPASEKAALEERLAKAEAEKLVAKAFDDGKLVEAQREWALGYAARDAKSFSDFVEKAPKVAPEKDPVHGADKPGEKEGTQLSDEELKVLKACGVTDEQIKKYTSEKKEEE